MALNKKKFELLGGSGNSVRIWGYTTTDVGATVDAVDYFNDVVDLLHSGDVIFINASDMMGQVWVNDAGANVDTTNLVAQTADSR